MSETYGLGSIAKDTRGGTRARKMDSPKICRICKEEWMPRTGPAAGLRDICYGLKCEEKRESDRRAAARARRRKKAKRERKEKRR